MKQNESLRLSIPKDQLSKLPSSGYEGKIVVIDKDEDIQAAVAVLSNYKFIGLDTETRPSFNKGRYYKVSLIQLATPEICFLFRINKLSNPGEIIKIIENENITKIGLSLNDDFRSLNKIYSFEPKNFIDLQSFVKDYHIIDNSLSRIHGIIFGEKISKAQRLTNWESSELTNAQKAYAALDAYACLKIYNHLKNGLFNPYESNYIIKENPENEEL